MIDLNKYREVIGAMACKLTDGSEVRFQMNLETGTGEIEIRPWSSDGEIFATCEDHITFAPVMSTDFLVLELMYEHAKEIRAKVQAETLSEGLHEALQGEADLEPAIFGTSEEVREARKVMSARTATQPPLVAVNGSPAQKSLQEWVSK